MCSVASAAPSPEWTTSEDAIESQDDYDADLEAIETDGDLVTYKVIIHEQ